MGITTRSGALRVLGELERRRDEPGPAVHARKLELLHTLGRTRLPTAAAVSRLHECLLFLRAYPDSPELLERVESLLQGFDRRADLRRHRDALVDSGIAGTAITYAFYFPTAAWMARRWPDRLRVDWDTFEEPERMLGQLPLLVPYSETPALDLQDHPLRTWLARLKAPGETDGTFLVRRFERVRGDGFVRQHLFEQHDPVLRLDPGPTTPSRTRARYPRMRVVYRRGPLDRSRPDLRRAVTEEPRSRGPVSPREGERLVDLARGAMITRARDLDVFMHADPRDVRLVSFRDGFAFAALGVVPERRLLLESVYGFLTLKNGVPIGYVLASALFGSSEVAYNVFETFRGGEAALHFGRALAMVRALFGSDTFSLDPYQLGHGNEEGLRSGAWWFYYKLGFRPDDAAVKREVGKELAAMRRNPRHRSSKAVLERLSAAPMFWSPGPRRRDVLGRIDLGRIGEAVSRLLAARFGAAREEGVALLAEEALRRLEVGSLRGWSAGERLAWERWAPVVAALDAGSWARDEREALAAVIRAKGARRETEFVARFDAHARLRAGLLDLSRGRRPV